MDKWAYKKFPTYKTLNKIILKTPKAEIAKMIFSLLSNPLVLFRRIFKGQPLDVQFNSQDVFGYMPPPKECWFRYMKFSKSENQEEKDHPQTYEPWTINEAQQDMCYSSRDD